MHQLYKEIQVVDVYKLLSKIKMGTRDAKYER